MPDGKETESPTVRTEVVSVVIAGTVVVELVVITQVGVAESVAEKLTAQFVTTPVPILIEPAPSVLPATILGLVPQVPAVGVPKDATG